MTYGYLCLSWIQALRHYIQIWVVLGLSIIILFYGRAYISYLIAVLRLLCFKYNTNRIMDILGHGFCYLLLDFEEFNLKMSLNDITPLTNVLIWTEAFTKSPWTSVYLFMAYEVILNTKILIDLVSYKHFEYTYHFIALPSGSKLRQYFFRYFS